MWLAENLDRAIPPDVLRTYLERIPEYRLYRRRLAAGLEVGFSKWDTYLRWRPVIFASTASASVISALLLWFRREKGPEAWGWWAASAIGNGAVAYLTRPTMATKAAAQASRPAPPPAPGQPAPPPPPHPVWVYLDARAEQEARKDPNFPDSTYRRLVQLPGMKEQWQRLPELAKATIV